MQLLESGLVGLEAETGRRLWVYKPLKKGGQRFGYCYSTPIARDDYVYYPCGGTLLKLVPTADGGVEAREVYHLEQETFWPRTGGAVLVGDYLYGCHTTGAPQCVEFLTGKPMWEQGRGPYRGYGGAPVIYADGNLYFRYENGLVALVPATPKAFQWKGQFQISENTKQCRAHPAISNGRLYLRHHDTVYCYNLKK